MDGSHWIGSIAFELRAADADAFDQFRRALRNDHDQLLRRPLQQALDRADRAGRLVRHRRIEVDLGSLGPDDSGDQLARRIADGLARGLADAGLESGRSRDRLTDDAEQLLCFLRTGSLPWPSSGKALEAICRALAGQDEAPLGRLAEQLRALFAGAPEAARRFVRQCPAKLVLRIAAGLAGLRVSQHRIGEPIGRYVRDAAALRLSAVLIQLARGGKLAPSELRWLRAAIAEGPAGASRRAGEAPLAERTAPVASSAVKSDYDVADAALPCADSDIDADAAILAEGLPLEAAGAVLLHPFLAGLFRAVGLLDQDGAFPTEEQRERAVLLLNYAATGQAEQAEPELALAKLLCGMELATVVARGIEPTELECAEVDSLLRAAIAHWGALGDTSPAALREAFLTRPGRLQRDGDDWRLVVEQRGFDVLLDRLPWALSLVRTPFMARPLRVDWR